MYSKRWFFPRYDHNKYHEPGTAAVFVNQINSSDTVLDVGTNLGFFAILAASLAKERSVHAFEMDDLCLPIILENQKLNSLTNLTVNNVGISDKSGEIEIAKSVEPNAGLSIKNEGIGLGLKKIKTTSVDEYCEQNNILPDFIKIDIEGAECLAVRGMTNTLALPNVKMLLEIHVEKLKNEFNVDYREVLKPIFEAGFEVSEIVTHREAKGEWRTVTSDTQLEENTMLYCTKKS